METGEKPAIPSFEDGRVIVSTDHFDVKFGYKEGQEGTKEGERTFLVPKSRKAEEVMLRSTEVNHNALSDRPFGKDEEIKAIRFNGQTEDLLKYLQSDEGQEWDVYGSGVPSLSKLDSEVSKK